MSNTIPYEVRLERKVLEIMVQMADEKWPEKRDFNKFFVKPVFGAKDLYKTARVLRQGGRNEEPRRLKLSEAIKASEILGEKLLLLISDAEVALRREDSSKKELL